jgi:hypothetical protein
LNLGLAEKTTEQGYVAVIAAIDSGALTIRDGRWLVEIIKDGISVRDAAEFRQKLQQLEAARVAQLDTLRSLAPARKRTVDVTPAPESAEP